MELVAGDVVRLKSEKTTMTIGFSQNQNDILKCLWFDEKMELQTADIPIGALIKEEDKQANPPALGVGDKVKLAGSKLIMTVGSITSTVEFEAIQCFWLDQKKRLHNHLISQEALVKVGDQKAGHVGFVPS